MRNEFLGFRLGLITWTEVNYTNLYSSRREGGAEKEGWGVNIFPLPLPRIHKALQMTAYSCILYGNAAQCWKI